MEKRYELSDAQWRRICHLLPGKAGDPRRTGADTVAPPAAGQPVH